MENKEVLIRFKSLVGKGAIWKTQSDMSRSLVCNRSQIGNIYSGRESISAMILKRLSENGVSTDWLLKGVGQMRIAEKQSSFTEKLLESFQKLSEPQAAEVLRFAEFQAQTSQLQA